MDFFLSADFLRGTQNTYSPLWGPINKEAPISSFLINTSHLASLASIPVVSLSFQVCSNSFCCLLEQIQTSDPTDLCGIWSYLLFPSEHCVLHQRLKLNSFCLHFRNTCLCHLGGILHPVSFKDYFPNHLRHFIPSVFLLFCDLLCITQLNWCFCSNCRNPQRLYFLQPGFKNLLCMFSAPDSSLAMETT